MKPRVFALLALGLTAQVAMAAPPEDIGFVSEHLPEIAMDNRYAELPLWSSCDTERGYCPSLNVGYASTHSQMLAIDGPMLALGLGHDFGRSSLTSFVFYDPLSLHSGIEQRPLALDDRGNVVAADVAM